MKRIFPTRFSALRATVHLLYHTQPRAFMVSAVASLAEPLFYPVFIIVLQRLLQYMTGAGGSAHFTSAVAVAGIVLVTLMLIQRLGIIVRDSSATILRQEAWVVRSGHADYKRVDQGRSWLTRLSTQLRGHATFRKSP